MTKTQVIDQAISEIIKNNNKQEYEVTSFEVANFLAEQIAEQSKSLPCDVCDEPVKVNKAGTWIICSECGYQKEASNCHN